MNELLTFGLGVVLGLGAMWIYTRVELKKIDLLRHQIRITNATLADNFMDVEEVREELKKVKEGVEANRHAIADMKAWVTGELMAIDKPHNTIDPTDASRWGD